MNDPAVAAQRQHGAARLLTDGGRQHGTMDGRYAGDQRLIAPQRAVQQRAGLRHGQQFLQKTVHISPPFE